MKTILIKENSKQAKAVIEMLKTMPFVEVVENTGLNKPTAKKKYPTSKNTPNAETKKAIEDAKKGIGLIKVKNSKDFFKQMGI